MNRDIEQVRSETHFVTFIETVALGIINMRKQPARIVVLIILLLVELIVQTHCYTATDVARSPLASLTQTAAYIEAVLLALLTIIAFVYCSGRPFLALWTEHNLRRAGITNRAGETPRLILRDHHHEPFRRLVLRSRGISLDQWRNRQSEIETALNINIVDIRYGTGTNVVEVYYVPAVGGLPTYISWDCDRIKSIGSMLLIGQSVFGLETIDLDVTPHVLIGGSTGSGKTVLMKALLYQCLLHHDIVHVVDFKGGLDYSTRVWGPLQLYTNYEETLRMLRGLNNILNSRIDTLKNEGYKNTVEYNHDRPRKLSTIIVFIDELAEMTDKTGRSKDDKAIIDELIKGLSTIARLGRAAGIHLIMGTQRPDANVLPGQIKNNIDYRICGRADDVLSRIVLDNDDAATIPKTVQGRFVNMSGREIQAFYFTDSDVILRHNLI